MSALRFLVISLIIHVTFWVLLQNLTHYKGLNNTEVIEVEYLDQNLKRLAHLSDNPSKLTLSKLKPRFYSDKDLSVEQETKAKNLGYLNKNQKQSQKSKTKNDDDNGVSKRLTKLGKELFNEEASSINDFHDIKEGAITALNSERFIYYTYFNRIDSRISNLWTSNLREYQKRWTNIDVEKLAGKSWVTMIEVLLDSSGNYVKTIIHRSSGVGPIDMAAISSFQASSFPNPPSAMVADDGFIHLKYAFRYDVEAPRRWARQ
ncbi:MAG: hypothetical protein IPM57_01665 [Oligoflexia bacterium]|nr:hypothetical protein [Oligoflexia bacterium]